MAILDTYSAPAAYSLRKVRTAYSGSAVRVRRNGDQAELDIGFSGFNLDQTALLNHTGTSTTQNLVQYSEQLDNAYWGKNATTVTADNTTAPDGTTTAELIDEGTSTNFHNVFKYLPGLSGTLCLSAYFKAGTRQYVTFGAENGGNSSFIVLNTTAWTATSVTTGTGTYSSHAITDVGSGWYRVSIVFGGITDPYIQMSASNVSNPSTIIPSFTGTSSTWYTWGFQVNNTSLRDYRRTTTETVDGGFGYVTTWYDQSGNGLDLTQTTASNQPRIVNAGVVEKVNNRPVLYFNGSMNIKRANYGVFRNKSYGHVFTVARFASSTPENRLIAVTTNSAASSRMLIGAGATSDRFFAAGRRLDGDSYQTTSGTAAVDESVFTRLTVFFNWTSSDLITYVNGTQDINNTAFQADGATSDTDSAEFVVGLMNFSNPFTGYVPEILFYNTDQSSNRTAIETNIEDYYIDGIDEVTSSVKAQAIIWN